MLNQWEEQNHGESNSLVRARLWRLAGPWWMLLLTGIAWLIVSVLVCLYLLYALLRGENF